jgi:hypothetical protein
MSPSRRAALTVVWTFYFGVLLNSCFGPLRLTPYGLNYLVVLAVLCIPCLRTPLTDGKRLMDFVSAEGGRIFTRVNVVLIAILIAPVTLANLYQAVTGSGILPVAFEDVRRFEYNGHSYHVVYSNFGAADEGAVAVERETPLLPFLIHISDVYSESASGDVEIVKTERSGFWIKGKRRSSIPQFVADAKS